MSNEKTRQMTREEFKKKWGLTWDQVTTDLDTLIASEISKAGRKEVFTLPFILCSHNEGTSWAVKGSNGDYVSIDFPSKEQAQWLCDRLNREC